MVDDKLYPKGNISQSSYTNYANSLKNQILKNSNLKIPTLLNNELNEYFHINNKNQPIFKNLQKPNQNLIDSNLLNFTILNPTQKKLKSVTHINQDHVNPKENFLYFKPESDMNQKETLIQYYNNLQNLTNVLSKNSNNNNVTLNNNVNNFNFITGNHLKIGINENDQTNLNLNSKSNSNLLNSNPSKIRQNLNIDINFLNNFLNTSSFIQTNFKPSVSSSLPVQIDFQSQHHQHQHHQYETELQQKLNNYFLFLLSNKSDVELSTLNTHNLGDNLENLFQSSNYREYLIQQQQNMDSKLSLYNLEYIKLLSRSYPELLSYNSSNYSFNKMQERLIINNYTNRNEEVHDLNNNCSCCLNELNSIDLNDCDENLEKKFDLDNRIKNGETWKKSSFVPYKKRHFNLTEDNQVIKSSNSKIQSKNEIDLNKTEKTQEKNKSQKEKQIKKEVLPNQPKKIKRCPHVWQFCADLLENDNFNPSIIKWLNKDKGIFKIVKPDKVAELWGAQKNRKSDKKMNYEKMARGMRYSRREGFFKKLDKEKNKPNEYGKQLVFQFSDKVVKNFEWKWSFST